MKTYLIFKIFRFIKLQLLTKLFNYYGVGKG